jgi:hypothetical protein
MNDAAAYGVNVEQQTLPSGTLYWKVVQVHHLLPAENGGNHHIYVDLRDETGTRVMGAHARVTWPGGEELVAIDKPAGEPGGNFPMWKHQVCDVAAVGVPGTNLPSDRVTGMHTTHPDEPPGNTLFHHSFAVDFQRARAEDDPPPASEKPLAHYVLVAPAESAAGQVDWQLAIPYVQAFGLTMGTQADAARLARRVTIIGSPSGGIALDTEQELVAAGCQVERIGGTPQEIMRTLAQRIASGTP